ncbi:MAG: type IX secretion system membrane protein PorP/SprF [Duncaniella sp.]|nr:type IX secretion system membrane protein PorP/SprF [Bacteroides sp.]MDE5827776.1 type IX secretion system membrane protein PorP/SprF [Duncaniella sp.]MBD5300306.1 type IX secretion system membrane protein PorP/SprF [Bacteroides sp.]MBD5354989.1 type IX secretion system membrane protein PorP/SprF [Bacteroides sp.]MDE6062147.1 type IX secretion system membrane protein PorP/SprF [Duncaniella sp.]
MTALSAVILWLYVTPAAKAQGDAQLTQYWALPTYYNPAAVGDTDYLRIRGGARMQWVGIDNAPRSFVAAADMPFKFIERRFGTGLVVQQESYGLFHNFTLDAQIGYKLKILKGELTVALQAGLYNQQFKGSEVYIPDDDDYHDSADDAIPQRDVAGYALDLGIGAFYVHKKFWGGISILHANNPTVSFTDDTQNSTSRAGETGGSSVSEMSKKYKFTASRTAYLIAGSNIPIKNTLFEVIPSLLVRSDFTTTDFQITGRVRYNKLFTAGLGYRYNDALSIMLGAEIKGIFIGYSYDYHLSEISRASSGSHELVAGYNLKLDFSEKNRHKHKSIRIL